MNELNKQKINTILIPNRGEIAVRIITAARRMGISTVVMLTHGELHTLPARLADEVALMPDGTADKNYLNIPLIISSARQYQADAIHPGYGYLSENAALAEACQADGILFIGPSVSHLRMMGSKTEARKVAREARVPLLPSLEGTPQELIHTIHSLSYPVLIKAAMGGGGKGMTIAHHEGEWEQCIRDAASQGERYFGNASVYAEQLLTGARHIEVQLLGDQYGNCVHLFDRECSIQRRYQKIIEEAPAPCLSAGQRAQITDDALRIARHIGYYSAGTIEFLLDANGNHYFLEMNTRIQVEHPVTELVTGIDLVALQIGIAMGEKLPFRQQDVVCCGHAIESRIYAEDPAQDFKPSPGRIVAAHFPKRGRIDTFIDGVTDIFPGFDPMIAKIIHHADTREKALALHVDGLRNAGIIGIHHNIGFLIRVLEHPDFQAGDFSTDWLAHNLATLIQERSELPGIVMAAYLWYKRHHADQSSGWDAMGYWRMIPGLSVYWRQQPVHIHVRTNENQICFSDGIHSHTLSEAVHEGSHLKLCVDGQWEQALYYADVSHFFVSWQGTTFVLTPSDWLQVYEPRAGKASDTGDELRAPMPGTIVKIGAQSGKHVKTGDLLLVLEAMKMENHLLAWKDGTVTELLVQGGENVGVNQILLTIS